MMNLITLIPVIIGLLENPAVKQLIPILMQLGQSAFPGTKNPAEAASSLFDTNGVKWVQTALTVLDDPLEVDGIYGDGTKDAVKRFQKLKGLEVDGWAGQKTTDALRSALLAKPKEIVPEDDEGDPN